MTHASKPLPTDIRALLAAFGPVRPQSQVEWRGPMDLPDAVAGYYAGVGPLDVTVDGYGNPFFLPALARLWDYQAGYRWHATTQVPLSDWPDDWLVVADQGSDPFIFSRASGRVLFAVHGTGRWETGDAFASLEEMAACLGTLGRLVVEAGAAFTAPGGEMAPTSQAAVLDALTGILGTPERAAGLLDRLGWI